MRLIQRQFSLHRSKSITIASIVIGSSSSNSDSNSNTNSNNNSSSNSSGIIEKEKGRRIIQISRRRIRNEAA